MKAVTWHGRRDIRVSEVPDPILKEPNDAIVRVTTTGLCGSDLHLYEVMGPFLGEGDVLGHEPMGIVEEVGAEVTDIEPGDRVVIPFNISCGHCWMCDQGLQSQCETTQVREQGTGAALFGYTKLYGEVPGGQAEYLRVPQAQYGPIKVPEGPPDDRFVYLSDVLPTAWQGVEYAECPRAAAWPSSGSAHRGHGLPHRPPPGGRTVIGVDLVPERLARAQAHGTEVIDLREHGNDLGAVIRDRTEGRGPDAVIEAVGMEAHGSPFGKMAHGFASLLPDPGPRRSWSPAAWTAWLRCTPPSTSCGGAEPSPSSASTAGCSTHADDDPFRQAGAAGMGQANVKRWIDDLLPLLSGDDDPLDVESFATHRLPLTEAPAAYEMFQKKDDGAVKVLFTP